MQLAGGDETENRRTRAGSRRTKNPVITGEVGPETAPVKANVEFFTTEAINHMADYYKMVKFEPEMGDYGPEDFRSMYNPSDLPWIVLSLHGDSQAVSKLLERKRGERGYYGAYTVLRKTPPSGRADESQAYYGPDAAIHLRTSLIETPFKAKMSVLMSPEQLFDDDTPLANEVARLLISYKIFDDMEAEYRSEHPIPPISLRVGRDRKVTLAVLHATHNEDDYTSYDDLRVFDDDRDDFPVARMYATGQFSTVIQLDGIPHDILNEITMRNGTRLLARAFDLENGVAIPDLPYYNKMANENGTAYHPISVVALITFDELTTMAGKDDLLHYVKRIINRRGFLDLAIAAEEEKRGM